MKRFFLVPVLAISFVLAAYAQQTVLSRNSNLRSGPSSGSSLKQKLPADTTVTVISTRSRSGYVRVKTSDGSTGWVLKRNIAPAEQQTEKRPAKEENSPAATGSRAGDAQIYPRADLTPGAPDPRVTQDNIAENICNPKWSTKTVRPPASVTNKIKRQTMKSYGFTDSPAHYELDHLLSLQIGGCPDCLENLWPQAYGDQSHPMTQNERAAWNREHSDSSDVLAGALEKDLVENHIHDEICFGIPDAKMSMYRKKFPPTVSVTLKRGQELIATDWYSCYLNMMDGNKPCK